MGVVQRVVTGTRPSRGPVDPAAGIASHGQRLASCTSIALMAANMPTTARDTSSAPLYAFLRAPSPDRASREGQRQRSRARREAAERTAPPLRSDRRTPIVAMLRAYREHEFAPGERSPIEHLIAELRREVEALELWAAARGRRAHATGDSIRRALAFLRTFGHLTSLDFSRVPIEERALLVELLALEHRWCYAAAGTTRDVFKVEIGRTGAR